VDVILMNYDASVAQEVKVYYQQAMVKSQVTQSHLRMSRASKSFFAMEVISFFR
jgi:hypothetical protein